MSKVMKVLFPVILCSLLIAVPSLQAFWCEDGVPVCVFHDRQRSMQTTYAGSGHTLLTWEDNRNLSDHDIYVQRLDATGPPEWTVDGLAICMAAGQQEYPVITNDGGGGAIVAWQDERHGVLDIFAQRVKSSGAIQWASDGVAVCTETGIQKNPQIVSDDAGGAIIVWLDERSADNEIYAQRISDVGKDRWAVDGTPVCTYAAEKNDLHTIADGSGGAIVVWRENRGTGSFTDVYSQRIDASGSILWTTDGVPVCTASGNQTDMQAVSDGAGGVIITWRDPRRGGMDIADLYTQRVNSAGVPQWTADGILTCTEFGEYFGVYEPCMTSDGAGGAIIAWHQTQGDSTFSNVYAQRVNHAGSILWDFNGVNLTPFLKYGQGSPRIVADGSGGAIIAWEDLRGDMYSVYAQKLDAAGIFQWRTNGAPLCTHGNTADNIRITEDGSGGAVVAWIDGRNGMNADLYAQWVDTGGMPGYRATSIASVADIPGDEGGWVRLTIEKHSYDDAGWFRYPIFMYNIWRRIDDPVMLSSIESAAFDRKPGEPQIESTSAYSTEELCLSGLPLIEVDGRHFLTSGELLPVQYFPPGTWEVLGSFNAFRQDEYSYVASTPSDSTSEGIPMPVFCVSAHTLDPGTWYVSAPDSGYSIDNLAPTAPVGLAGTAAAGPPGIDIDWDPNSENDFSFYIVHRGSYPTFIPSRFTEVGRTSAPEITDEYELWYESYYKICAIDRHGNASPYALLGPDDLTGEDLPDVPVASYLGQNYPNPFNPSTTIAFGLSRASRVKLKIYDTSGRLVKVLIDEDRGPGRYAASWDGLNSRGLSAASGVYYFRLTAESFDQTNKMILLR